MRVGARLGRLAAGLLAAALLLFALPFRLPGGAAAGFLGSRADDPAAITALRRDLHLQLAPPVRFVAFAADAGRGDLGRSPISGIDVGAATGQRAPESLLLAVVAVLLALAATTPIRKRRAAGPLPAPSAVPGALWVLPLVAAALVANRFGAVPNVGPHAAVSSRVGASLLPVATLGAGLAVWLAAARRTRRDVLAAVLVGTLVTEVVFSLPGLGSLLADAVATPDPLTARGVLLVLLAIAVTTGALILPFDNPIDDLAGGPSSRRRATTGVLSAAWIVALVGAVLVRVVLGLDPAGRISSDTGAGVSRSHVLGTDVLGRDVLDRLLGTARGSMLLAVAAMLVAMAGGLLVGVVVGFAGGWLERLGLAFLTGWAAVPGELVAVAFLAFNGRDGRHAALALAFVAAPGIARAVQRRTLHALRASDARAAGMTWLRSVRLRAAGGFLRPALATLFVGASRVVVAELVAGLLGVGPSATQTWSHEVVVQLGFAAQAPLAVIVPAVAVVVTAAALTGVGNAIRPARPLV